MEPYVQWLISCSLSLHFHVLFLNGIFSIKPNKWALRCSRKKKIGQNTAITSQVLFPTSCSATSRNNILHLTCQAIAHRRSKCLPSIPTLISFFIHFSTPSLALQHKALYIRPGTSCKQRGRPKPFPDLISNQESGSVLSGTWDAKGRDTASEVRSDLPYQEMKEGPCLKTDVKIHTEPHTRQNVVRHRIQSYLIQYLHYILTRILELF
jgi:hypothetical protein